MVLLKLKLSEVKLSVVRIIEVVGILENVTGKCISDEDTLLSVALG